jgi:hypothetical protein
MYILPHLCVAKDFWNFKILDQFWKISLSFKSFKIPHIFKYECFFNVVNRSLSSF